MSIPESSCLLPKQRGGLRCQAIFTTFLLLNFTIYCQIFAFLFVFDMLQPIVSKHTSARHASGRWLPTPIPERLGTMTEISGKRSAQVLFELAELTALMSSHLVAQQQQLHQHMNAIEHLKAQNFAQECAIQALLGACPSVEAVAERYLNTRKTVTSALDKRDAQAFQAAFEPYAKLLSALSSQAHNHPLND